VKKEDLLVVAGAIIIDQDVIRDYPKIIYHCWVV
jgi:hypothetical protein